MNIYVKRQIQNLAIVFLVLIGLKNLLYALPFKFAKRFDYLYSNIISPNVVAMSGVLSFTLGVLMLLLAYRLYKRVRTAWIIEIMVLCATIVLYIVHFHKFTIPIIIIELIVLAILTLSYKDFCLRSNRVTIRLALLLIGISFLLVILNATIGISMLKINFKSVNNILDAFMYSAKLLIFMDTSVLEVNNRIGLIYADSLIIINWICIFFSVLFLLKPIVYNHLEDKYDKDKVRRIVLKYGQNPTSYLSLEDDKKYFFSNDVVGVCSYTIVGNIMVCCGDIICDSDDGFTFLSELMAFCKQNGWNIMMLNVTDYFLELYKSAGFGVVKYGEDACFKLSDYNLAGGKVAKVRAAINHANKAGIIVMEYKPNENKDINIEREIQEISNEWFMSKPGEEMSFMLGGTGLYNPMDRRYFYARDFECKMLGFVVFIPYLSGKGYLADVTRRRNNAPQGVLEKIIYDAFMVMKNEAIEWGNMGLSPLYNVAEGDKVALTEKLFAYIYDNINNAYGFKALHHAKEKYAPTEWQTRYVVYHPKPFTPQFAYAIVKAQNPKGIKDIIYSEIAKKKNSKESTDNS